MPWIYNHHCARWPDDLTPAHSSHSAEYVSIRCHLLMGLCIFLKSWWRHQMETFSALLALCAGNSPVTVNSPHKGQWRGALMFSLICVWINSWVNNREAGDLRRRHGHYDASVMCSAISGKCHRFFWKCSCYSCISSKQNSIMIFAVVFEMFCFCFTGELYRGYPRCRWLFRRIIRNYKWLNDNPWSISDIKIDPPCGIWCRGWTACVLYGGPLLGLWFWALFTL